MKDHTDTKLNGKAASLWLDTTPELSLPEFRPGMNVDVAIVGGGIVGLTTAALLKEAGKTVAVLEARQLLHGVTGYTTAKITSQHGLIYGRLVEQFGEEKARLYGEANQAGIETITRLIEERGISCGFQRTEAYTYTSTDEEVEDIRKEAEIASRLGLPATLTESTSLPFPIKAALRFEQQAQFHPRQYLQALALGIPGEGSHVFEHTRVFKVDGGKPCTVHTKKGNLHARSVILASHYPLSDKALFALRLIPNQSYVIAVRLASPAPRGTYIDAATSHSLRMHPVTDGELLLVGGEGHRVGEGGDTVDQYRKLEAWARERFDVKAVEYRWSTFDHRSIDGVPYIGLANPFSQNLYVATGFGGWGMTNGTAAALLLKQQILGNESPWSTLFTPGRVGGMAEMGRHMLDVGRHFLGDRLSPAPSPESIGRGEGGIVTGPLGRVALYRDEKGEAHALSPVCPHMGCHVKWNPAEKTWDCPCHGSRFDTSGEIISGPALQPLQLMR